MRLLMLCPSRHRPHNIERLIAAWDDTEATADLLVRTDDDEPAYDLPERPWLRYERGPRLRLGPTLNELALANVTAYDAIGFLGDDHLPRTPGWDRLLTDALTDMGGGVVYGDDLLQGGALATAVVISTDIIAGLGWFAVPGCTHLYLDNGWMTVGHELGALRYVPEAVLEHLHPVAGKADEDNLYREVNAASMYDHDAQAFEAYHRDHLADDLARVRRVRS